MSSAEAREVIESLRDYLTKSCKAGKQVNEETLTASDMAHYPSRGEERPQIVLMSESFAELGGPKLGSRAAILATAEEGSVEDGRITLIGPDQLQEGDSYAWGIAVFVEAPDSLEETYLQARRQNLGNAIEGCMLKSPLENAWCRVGTAAAAKGLRPLDVAAAYLAKTKQTVKDAKVEVLMELAPPQGLGEFAALLQNESDRYLQVLGADMSSRGVDLNCVPGSHCGSCADKQACAEIQKMRRARKAASGDQKER